MSSEAERIEGVTLPDSRLRSMLAGAFRYGADRQRDGEIESSEWSYALSEDHANKLVDHFIEAGHIILNPQEPKKR